MIDQRDGGRRFLRQLDVVFQPELAGQAIALGEAIAQLRDLDIPVLVIYAPSIEGVYDDIELIGRAVDEVDLNVPAGQSLAVMGPSGCGKTTTVRQYRARLSDAD